MKPTPPTEEEVAEFEAWSKEYLNVLEKGEERGWLNYHPYCDGAPEPWSPVDEYGRLTDLYNFRQRQIEKLLEDERKLQVRTDARKKAKEEYKRILKEAGIEDE